MYFYFLSDNYFVNEPQHCTSTNDFMMLLLENRKQF